MYIIVRFMAKILKAENIQTDLLGSNGNSAFSLQRNSSSLLTLHTNDCVGINTTSPSHKLEVRGSSNPVIAIISDDQLINQGANFSIDLKNSSSTLFEGGNISVMHSASNQTASAESAYMRFSTRNNGAVAEKMRITPNGGIAFGGAANYGTTAHVLKSAGDAAPVWGFVTNANVDSAAAIAYSKLSLGSSIVNADISASAAIAYSKLSLDTSIVNGDIATNAGIAYSKLSLGTSIVNADVSATAGIVDTKLATISTAGKVSNSATTATAANTASTIVLRDASNNFSAGTITATLSGTASTANALATGNNYQVNSLGVGTAASGSAGEIRALSNITAYYGLSDKRLKENITPLKNVLKKLENINGYNFNYKTRPNQKMVGVIAQELLEEFPELIYETVPIDETSGLDKAYAVRYELLTSILLQAIKELSSEVNKLKNNK